MGKKDDLRKKQPKVARQRCGRKTVAGTPCKKWAILGGAVCQTHGGGAPQVKEKARQRLLEMLLPAMAELNKILRRPDTADGDRLRAIKEIADRTGITGSVNVTVELMQKFVDETAGDDLLMTYSQNEEDLQAENEELRREVERLRTFVNAVHPQPAITATRDPDGALEPTAVYDPGDPWAGPSPEDERARLRRYERRLDERGL